MSLEVIAIGARTPVGLLAETTAAAVRARICRIRDYGFIDASGEAMMIASDAKLGSTLEGPERLFALGRSVIDEVARKLAEAPQRYRGPVDLWLSLPESHPGWSEVDAIATVEAFAAAVRNSGTQLRAELVGRGHAGIAVAIERAVQESGRGADVLTVVLGIDSYLHPETLLWLERNRQFGRGARNGFVPGEAAGCLVLASTRLRHALGLPCLATIAGVATAREQRLPDSETGSFGEGMTQAVLGALAGLQLPAQAVDHVISDINGERYRSEEWAFVAMRAPEAFRSLSVEAPADCWGDVGAASGALFGVLAVRSWARDYACGPRTLLMTGSTSGLRGAILLQQPSDK